MEMTRMERMATKLRWPALSTVTVLQVRAAVCSDVWRPTDGTPSRRPRRVPLDRTIVAAHDLTPRRWYDSDAT
jgi:hypothetical protein